MVQGQGVVALVIGEPITILVLIHACVIGYDSSYESLIKLRELFYVRLAVVPRSRRGQMTRLTHLHIIHVWPLAQIPIRDTQTWVFHITGYF